MAEGPQTPIDEPSDDLERTRPHIERGPRPAVRRTYGWYIVAAASALALILLIGWIVTFQDDTVSTDGIATTSTSDGAADTDPLVQEEVPDQNVAIDLSEMPEQEPAAEEEPPDSVKQVTRIPAVFKVKSRSDCEPYDPEGMTWYRYSKQAETKGQLIVTCGQDGLFTTSGFHRDDAGDKVYDNLLASSL